MNRHPPSSAESRRKRLRRTPAMTGLAASALLLLLHGACVAPTPPDDGETLYRHNWWNYYTRAATRLRQGRTADAEDDFARCLGLLDGVKFPNASDMWRARTYGLHFVEGYFPNREYGICLYERQAYTQAVVYLERSLEQEPSGRAKHYLNQARRQQLTGQRVPPPQLRLAAESAAPLYTRALTARIAGTASGAARIRELVVGGRADFIELAEPEVDFSRDLPLRAGTNVITVEASDLLGRRATLRTVRIADWQPPRLLIRSVTAHAGGWRVEGLCRDEYGVAKLSFNGHPLLPPAPDPVPPSETPFTLDAPAGGGTLRVSDLAGNVLTVAVTAPLLHETAGMDAPERLTPTAPHAAFCLAALQERASLFGEPTFLTRAEHALRASSCRAVSERQEASFVLAAAPADRLRPSLTLSGLQTVTRIFTEDAYLDGTAADGGGLAAVSVNGENLLAAVDLGTVRTYFARRLTLDPGTNLIEVAAADRAGNQTIRTFTVIRDEPEHLDPKHRLSVGVPPLTPPECGLNGVRAKRAMEAELTRSPARFRLLERDEGWEYVLREQNLSLSDLADPSAALRLGKMVPAEMLFMARIFQEAKGLTVHLKAVATENGEILFASDVYSPDSDRALDDAVAGLILKVQQGFPLVSGEVLRSQGARVTLNIGRADGVTEHSRFLVIRAPSAARLAEGRLALIGERPVQAEIERLQSNSSLARIVPPDADALVKEGDYVYAR